MRVSSNWIIAGLMLGTSCSSESRSTPMLDGGMNDTDGSVDAGADGGLEGCVPDDPPCDGTQTGPAPLNEHVAGYFDSRQEMVIFGGNTAVPVNCGYPDWVYQDTTWIFYDYENSCGQWTEVVGAGPSARGRHAGATSESSFWIFGGRFRPTGASGNYTLYSDLWRFDAAPRTWTQVTPASGDIPSARANAAVAWDSSNDKLWLFGGNSSASGVAIIALDDVWSFDVASSTWTLESTSGAGPSPRLWHSMIYDSERHRLVVFGGGDETAFNASAIYFSDLFALDLTTMTWSELHDGTSETAPDGRFWSTMTYDPENDRYLIFGGHDAGSLGNRNDTWVFSPSANTWTRLQAGDTFNAPASGFCDFPADFASVDHDGPERRNAASLVWSGTCGHAVLFGGKTDCGAIADVWRYDGDSWESEFSSGAGEVCIRARGSADTCTSLCF